MAKLPMGGCVTPVRIMQDVWDPLGLYLNRKYLKSGQKWPSIGQFTNGRLRETVQKWGSYGHLLIERLRESIGN